MRGNFEKKNKMVVIDIVCQLWWRIIFFFYVTITPDSIFGGEQALRRETDTTQDAKFKRKIIDALNY